MLKTNISIQCFHAKHKQYKDMTNKNYKLTNEDN